MHRYLLGTCALVLVAIATLSLTFRNTASAKKYLYAMQLPSTTNVALSSNGAVASASSSHSSGNFPVAAVNNGDRKAQNWGSGGGWNDNTQGEFSSDVVQINFPAANFVNQINVFTLRNNFQDNHTAPTLTETFNTCENSGNGITEFEVQYWNGAMWVTVPGGLIRNNNKVWRQISFPEVSTSSIRVQVHGAVRFTSALNFSRIVEIEAFGRTAGFNLAASANGGVAFASSQFNANYPVSAVNDGDRTGFNWGRGGFGSGWNDATQNEYSIDWVRIDFPGGQQRRINEIDVYTLRDGFSTKTDDPSIFETFNTADNTGQGATDYDVQYLSGGNWVPVPGGKVTNNNKVRRQFRFSPFTTNAIRVVVNKGANFTTIANNWSRLVEIEAWENSTIPDDTVWVGDSLPTGAIQTGDSEGWNWICSDPLPLSGTLSHASNVVTGIHQHYFYGATQTLTINPGDTLVAHVFLDPVNPPTQVMLQWNDGTWEHRAYWGASQIPWGVEGTISRRNMGVLPPTGQWVRLEVPASLVGLENRTINGMAFSLFNGKATWDHGGKFAGTVTPTPTISIGDATVIEGSCGGAPKAVFNLTLSSTSPQTISVNYATSNGTAVTPSDYVAASGTVTFMPNMASRTIEVFAKSDIAVEADETFIVQLSNPVNVNIGDGQGQAIILNDDQTAPASDPSALGQWGPCEELETVPVHANLLPDGRLLYWGRDKNPDTWDNAGSCNTYWWDPVTKVKSGPILNPFTNLFCSAQSFLSDGRLLVAGGHNRYEPNPDVEGIGDTELNIFNYQTNTWSLSPNQMEQGRWYPSSVMLGDGDIGIFAGAYWDGVTFQQGKPFPVRNEFANIYTAQQSLFHSTAQKSIRNYPYLHLAADGRVFGLSGKAGWFYDQALDQYTNLFVGPLFDHFEGSSVLYNTEAGKVMVVGGRSNGGTTLSAVNIFDIPSQTWATAAPTPSPMNFKRQYQNTTLLPDGKVLATGGQQCDGGTPSFNCPAGAANFPESWNPVTRTWTTLAENPTRTPRIYHSIALLLPDGRVLVGGGGLPAANGDRVVDTTTNTVVTCSGFPPGDPVICRHYGHKDVEIYSPPYLFAADDSLAPRPAITSAPAAVALGDTFNVSISSGLQVNSAVLMRLPTVTHGLNFDQRRVVLTLQAPSTTNLTLTVPSLGSICPPGYYMLFVLNSSGVPSVSRMIKVTLPSGPQTFPTSEVGSRMTRNLDGRLQVFYKGADNALWTSTQTSVNANTWTSHVSLLGGLTSNPVAVANADGRLEVFVKGTDNAIYHRWQMTAGSSSWSGWIGIPGTVAGGDPAVARNTDGRLQVVYRGGDNLLYTVAQTSPGVNSWTMPANLFGTLISDPAVVLNADGRMEVFAVMTDNGISHIWQTSAGGSSWSGWFGLGGFTSSLKPDAARNTDGFLQAFYRDAGNTGLSFFRQSPSFPGGWSPATSLGGGLVSAPTVGINADGRLEVFIRGTDNQLHHIWQTAPSGSTWSAWTPLGGGLTSGAAPAQNANGRVAVIVRGLDNALYYNVQTAAGSSSWTGFFPLGGNASSF
jgi:hypothetical protein